MGKTKPAQFFVASSAVIDKTARIGAGTKVWEFAQIADRAEVGRDCVIGSGVYIDRHVKVGDRVRIHNKALLYQGLVVEDDVFIGPAVCFTNDRWPRSGSRRNFKGISWKIGKGASIGANATVLPDVQIGTHAMVGAGSVVNHDVPPHGLVFGNPAKLYGFVCDCEYVLKVQGDERYLEGDCSKCGKHFSIDISSLPEKVNS